MSSRTDRRRVVAGMVTLAASLSCRPLYAQSADVLASTGAGKVRGKRADDIFVFKGIRYGADTAASRFAAPMPPSPWSDVHDAFAYGASTPQGGGGDGGGLFSSWTPNPVPPQSEDCLFLNVWTPALRDAKRRPVMLWLHGGGFAFGSGSSAVYDGTRLAKRGDVVVITINHRLNLFGHLYLADYGDRFADSGNVGLLDVVLALQWVRDNVAEFGGDPHNVMIFGESGGGAKVSVLMAMDAPVGLYQRAAVESGAWLTVNEASAAAAASRVVVDQLGLTRDSIDQIQTMPVEKIQAAARAAARSGGAGAGSGPVVDGRSLKRHPFTPDAPEQSRNIPLLIGFNRTESTLLVGPRDPDYFRLTWDTLPGKLSPLIPGVEAVAVIAKYRQLHPAFSASDVFFAATTDSRFLRGHIIEASRKADQAAAPVFLYMLDWDTPVDGGRWRAPHALEIGFVFDNVAKSASMMGSGAEQQRIADLMSSSWIAFARTGKPSAAGLPAWPGFNSKAKAAMVFGVSPKVVHDPHGEERRLFDAMPMEARG
jgi:para-nitrobenzyl esterase